MAENESPADGYAAAQAELEQIVRLLEAPDVDVDALAAHVDRAAELIRFCRERLTSAEIQVIQIVADLDTGSEVDTSSGGADPGPGPESPTAGG